MSRVSRLLAAAIGAVIVTSAPAAAVPLGPPDVIEAERSRPAGRPAIERVARTQIGAPYSYSGMSPAGFDCSGFTSWVYSHIGVTLPHSSSAQYALGTTKGFKLIEEPEDLVVGDLVFHATGGDGVGHAGIYVGDGSFISATSSEGVQIRSLSDSYWGPLWVGGVRVLEQR